jgi:hypothetical protein
MRRRRAAALVTAVGACIALVSGAGAASHLEGRVGAAQFDLSTRTGVVRYLASVGLHSHGFVIQRGQRNYAGPRCPGKGWTCTRSTRVVQVATRPGAVNRYEYTATATATATAAPTPSPCGAVQNGPSNNAKAIITTGSSQSCTITQNATGSGGNFVQLSETIQQNIGASQTASQDAQVTQTSQMGSNNVQISQKITQAISENAAITVTESQESDQTFSVKQNVTQSTPTVGTNSSRVDQSLTQTESATSATSGSQYQRANLIGHVDQFSHALSTSQNNQTESQSETATVGSPVSQTQIGPTRCCTSQGDNTRDTFKVVQKTTQTNNSANRSYTEDAQIDLSTTGSANGSQTITQNGNTTRNSSTGSTVNLGTTCTQGTCTPTQTGFPSGDVFVSVGEGQVQEWKPDGTFVQTLDTTTNSAETTGLAFDASGNLYVTDWTASDVTKFTSAGSLAGSFGTGYDASHPESIVFDAAGNAYVGLADATGDSLLKFDSAGQPVASFSPVAEDRGTDWIDLAPDQCTVYYTSEGTTVKTFNVCTDSQGADFATGLPGTFAYALRLLPGGGALVADTQTIVRLDATGQIVQQYDDPGATGFWFSLALDRDGTTFWAGDPTTGEVAHFNIATGSLLSTFTTTPVSGSINQAGGIAIAP